MWAWLLGVMVLEIGQKRCYMIESRGIGSSNGVGIQDNDGGGNQPKRYLYGNQISRIGF